MSEHEVPPMVVPTGEVRVPTQGEWFWSLVAGGWLRAPYNFRSNEFPIGREIPVHTLHGRLLVPGSEWRTDEGKKAVLSCDLRWLGATDAQFPLQGMVDDDDGYTWTISGTTYSKGDNADDIVAPWIDEPEPELEPDDSDLLRESRELIERLTARLEAE